METSSASPAEDDLNKSRPVRLSPAAASSDSATRAVKFVKSGGVATTGKTTGSLSSAGNMAEGNGTPDSSRPKSTLMKPTLSSSASSLPRRNSMGGLSEKQAVKGSKRSSIDGKKVSPSVLYSAKKSSTESRRSSLPPASSKGSTPEAALNGKKASLSSRLLSKSSSGTADSMQRSTIKALKEVSSSRSLSSSLESSNGRSRLRKTTSNVSSPSVRSPSVTSSLVSASASVDRNSLLPGRKKTLLTAESGDSRFMMLPQVDAKIKDDLRLDLRGHRIRSLDAIELNLSPTLEHLRLEENPILQMLHVEAASILLVGPTLKKFNDRDLSPKELEVAKSYPAHTSICIRDGWQYDRPELAAAFPPSLNFLSLTGDYRECEVLTASYGYVGGHEGRSLYNWYLHDEEGSTGILVPEASGFLQYRITKDAINKFISFKCTPVRIDGIIGEPRTFWAPEQACPGSPKLLSLKIVGEGVEGTTLYAEKKYWGGEEGNSVYHWFLMSPDGAVTEIEGSKSASYKVSCSDIGFLIYVSCEPIRSDWAHGPTVTSEHVGPIVPGPPSCHLLEFRGSLVEGNRISFVAAYNGGEKGSCIHEWFRLKESGIKEKLTNDEFLELTYEDVGRWIELVYTPVREDGLRGSQKSHISSPISPADPKGIELIIPDCLEDEEIIPLKSYYGGKEGNGEYVWYRTRFKPDESNMLDVSSSTGDFVVVGNNMMYTPTLEDVGSYLVLYWVPTRDDWKQGSPVIAVGSNPVMAALPVVSNVCIKHLGSVIYEGEGKYHGGSEGSSIYSWYRQTSGGSIILITGAISINYKAKDPDYNCRLLFGYTPIRSDSAIGELVLSETSNIVLPELPKILLLSFNGKEVEGEILTAVELTPKTENQKHVWNKYIKDVKYQWFYSVGMGEHQSFELFPSQQSCSYRALFEDIGHCLKCECTVTDVFGRSSETVLAVTCPILPGMPKICKLEIEGRGFHTNLYAVRGLYSGGKEGKSKIQWLRSMVGSPDLISIPGEVGRMYEANVDDVGYRLVAIYTPIREDGVEGEPVSTSTDPIAVEPDVYREVKQKLEIGSVKFEALIDKDKKVPGVGNLERRVLEVNRKRVKVVKPGSKTSFSATEIRGTYVPPFHVELCRNDQHHFKIVVNSEDEVDLMVQTRHMRDIIVLVIRGLAQRFNSTSLNSLLKIDN